ncbi:MAG: (Fe-S)-binding protein [Syntrophaceae bacterium]|nr:(Fe-S)-binding protein [Syntrophaceae bacterium]
MRVQLFATCLVDTFYPETGEAVLRLLRHFGVEVAYPREQTCCGKPANSGGHAKQARKAAEHFISVFRGPDPVVIPSGSCASMVKNHYPGMFHDNIRLFEASKELASRTFELSQFLVNVLKAHERGFVGNGKITYHASCQLTRELAVRQEPLTLINSIEGVEFCPMPSADRCCGFGGVFMGKLPEISMALADEKLDTILESGADTVTGCDHGCLMNISDAVKRRGADIKVKHLAVVLAEGLR